MIAAPTAVLLLLLFLAWRYTSLGIASLVIGIGIGAVYGGTTLGTTLGGLTTDTTTAISTTVQNVADRVIK